MQITFELTPENALRVVDAMEYFFPIPMSTVPPETPGAPEPEPLFTKAAWAKECVRMYMIKMVRRYERKVAMTAAVANVILDDEIVS